MIAPLPACLRTLRVSHLALALALGGATLAVGALPAPGFAQSQPAPTALLADSVQFDGTQLIATGAVEVLQGTTRLTAERIIYDQGANTLSIEGPIRLSRDDSSAVILASSAQIDAGLKSGIMSSARLVIDQQMQLAAARLDVVNERYTRLNRTVASACEVCASNPVPLWEIRAREVIHDNQAQQVYFNGAQLRVAGVPIIWLPRLRVPDPSLKRANGFLIPELRTDSTLGVGIEVPYFITLGDHRDLTVAPFISTKSTTLNLRYRQAFTNGDLELNGAISHDDTRDGLRAYLYAEGRWDLGRGLTFGMDLRATSDIAYLVDYDIYDGDDLPSTVTLTRFSSAEALDAQLTYFRSLRDSSTLPDDQVPFLLSEVSYERLVQTHAIPGQLNFGTTASVSYRASGLDVVGYDVMRVGANAAWTTTAIFGPGLRLDTTASSWVDAYALRQNSNYDSSVTRMTTALETKLSWPLTRQSRDSAAEILEPILQIGWADSFGGDVPNTDSEMVEFDEGNLLTLARFPGADRRETGLTSAAGLRFSHYGETGSYGLTLGRVLYLEDHSDYSEASGLDGSSSNWLVGAGMRWNNGLSFTTRSLFDDNFDITKWETRLDYLQEDYAIGTTYSYVIADALEERDTNLSELGLDGRVRLKGRWEATAEYLYDFNENEATRAGLGLQFTNECTRLSLALSRRYSDTDALNPTTSVSLSIGFGAFGIDGTTSKSCAL